MAGPNKKVEVHCGVFDYVSTRAAEAIRLITEGKKNDRLSLNEAQAIKVLCEMCIDCFNYRDEMQEKNAARQEDSSERSDQEGDRKWEKKKAPGGL